ncbi:MAG: hypothetical protein WC729_21090 [Sphingomonas sp.]|jgi:hypothetical protein|uniref:hypothetical protein n=1 Tax=Sphingomonas sp. TaxID=28214 RepID=UPI003565D907
MGIALAVALLTGQVADTGPLEAAWKGQLQCYEPDTVKKTCRSLAEYRRAPDGSITNIAHILLVMSPTTVWNIESPVRIEAGAICGAIRQQDIDASDMTTVMDGTDMEDPKFHKRVDEAVEAIAKPILGRDICTRYAAEGKYLIAKISIDGVAQPAMDQKVIWVAPDAGFRVRP